jgi:hypothetical protein
MNIPWIHMGPARGPYLNPSHSWVIRLSWIYCWCGAIGGKNCSPFMSCEDFLQLTPSFPPSKIPSNQSVSNWNPPYLKLFWSPHSWNYQSFSTYTAGAYQRNIHCNLFYFFESFNVFCFFSTLQCILFALGKAWWRICQKKKIRRGPKARATAQYEVPKSPSLPVGRRRGPRPA